MNSISPADEAQVAAWEGGRMPGPEQVRPGLWSVPIPFPGNLLRYTLSYLLVTEGRVVVIDPGFDDDGNWALLQRALESVGCGLSDVSGVAVTHYHLDHWGMADRIAAASGCGVSISRAEHDWHAGRSLRDFAPQVMEEWYRGLGVPGDELAAIMEQDDITQVLMHDAPVHLLDDDRPVPGTGGALRAVATPGHTIGHMSFAHDAFGVLISGDHMLPSASTNVSLTPYYPGDPLADYVASLERLRPYASYEVLAAHQYRFTGLERRIDAILSGIARRAEAVRAIAAEHHGATVWEVAAAIPRKRASWGDFDPLTRRLALGEAAAYLRHLELLPEGFERILPR